MLKKLIILLLIGLGIYIVYADYFQKNDSRHSILSSVTGDKTTPIEKHEKKLLELGDDILKNAKKKGVTKKDIITIVDFSEDSARKRLWVYDTSSKKILYTSLVAHGHNSGFLDTFKFSNEIGSHESSIGVYLTGDTYEGEHGYSLKLNGIDGKFNDNAASRHIVIHKAKYATEKFLHDHNYLGRSYGCFAVEPHMLKPIVNTIKDGTILIAYFPNRDWFKESPFIDKDEKLPN